MKNRILKTALLTTLLPMAVMGADSNLTQHNDPFFDDPAFKHFQKMQEKMNKIMEEFNQDFFNDAMISPRFKSHFSNNGFGATPNTDLVDKGEKYELKMDLAGMDDKSIKIDINGNYLSVKAKSEESKEKKEGDKIIRQERHVGMIQRGMTLPKDADAQNYKSSYDNGVLTITIPKKH